MYDHPYRAAGHAVLPFRAGGGGPFALIAGFSRRTGTSCTWTAGIRTSAGPA